MPPAKHAHRPCPVTGCTALARKGSLFCWEHWTHLPRNLQFDIRETERRHGVMSAEFRDARAAALNWWDREGAA